MTFEDLKTLARNSFVDTPRAFAQLQALRLPMQMRVAALLLAVTLSSILAAVAAAMFPVTVETGLNALTRQPLMMAVAQLGGLTLAAALMASIGRAFGGKGDFADSLLVVTWIELLLLVVQAAQVVLMMIFPLFASVLGIAAIAAFLFLTVQFTRSLHGFSNAFLVFLGMIGAALLAGVVLSILAGTLGIMPPLPESAS